MRHKKVFLWYLDVTLAVLHYKNNDIIRVERFKFAFKFALLFSKTLTHDFLTNILNYLIFYFLRK